MKTTKKLMIYKLTVVISWLDNKSHDIVLLAKNEEEARSKASVYDERFKSSNVRCYEMGVASKGAQTGGGLKSPWWDIISIHIEEEDATKLLPNAKHAPQESHIFDKFGNYLFPTDIKMESPNNACGTIMTVKEETPKRVYLVYHNSYYTDQGYSIIETGEVESGLLDRFCTDNNLKIIGKYYTREEAEEFIEGITNNSIVANVLMSIFRRLRCGK